MEKYTDSAVGIRDGDIEIPLLVPSFHGYFDAYGRDWR